ncbi:hypothetical protein U9M48_001901 [Paspalum notatum var. saurae]|uniref:AMP-dependent synthetase/ligase domain-containing protein n=1 Tax=Paspalum notatum var. saurae TaxID=547442 RepID=A0AAQ3PGC1_PASNO
MAAVDPRSGYCAATGTFHSLHQPPALPPPTQSLAFPAFALSLLPSPLPPHAALVDAATGEAVSFPAFLARVRALARSLRAELGLSRGDVALVLAPNSVHVPVLVYALMSIGAVVSPVNPTLTAGEIARLVEISKPAIAFAVPTTATKLPSGLPAVLLDSPMFHGWLQLQGGGEHGGDEPAAVVVQQSDTAAIEYSSGTTAAVKAVALSHGSFIAALALIYEQSGRRRLDMDHAPPRRVLQARSIATSMGFIQMLVTPALGDTLVLMSCAVEEGVRDIMGMVERHRVTDTAVPPPLVVAMARGEAAGFDVSSLRRLLCGGAALPVHAEAEFRRHFPGVLLGVVS